MRQSARTPFDLALRVFAPITASSVAVVQVGRLVGRSDAFDRRSSTATSFQMPSPQVPEDTVYSFVFTAPHWG